jgi:ABC-2 type transport system permease protein
MSNVLRVARKELGSFFSSLAAFIFIGVFLAVCLFTFFWVSRFFARNIADIRPLFEWMPVLLIFLVSGLTMRMWSEERRAGTLEFLMTSPARPVHLVLGKFLACLGLVAIALALTLPLPILVAAIGPLDWGPVIGGYLATLCLAAAYISIGLFVSARTDNQIVSLIVTALICGFFYVIGSDALVSLFGNAGGETLRLIGTGSRFSSIERGVIDLRDLFYYASIVGVFLVLNLYALESLRWSGEGREGRHMQWRLAAALVIANLIAGNFWLGQLGWARIDLTQGNVYSLSDASRNYLRQLQEPLLLRGYFSAQTHPLLAPLAPRLRDLLTEYEVASGGKVRVEIIDPAKEPQLEAEANSRYNIKPVPFQTSSKYQAAVTNSYFNLLVKYGDGFETLGYQNLIEIKQADADLQVDLLNPEYEITRAIKKVVSSYRGGSDVFSVIPQKITLEAYVSAPENLPDPLPKLRADLETVLGEFKAQSQGKFDGQVRNPDEGALARQLQEAYGLRPLTVGLLSPKQFWFHLVLRSGEKAVQVQLPESMDKEGLKASIEAELKRFTPGALRNVALYTPPVTPPMPHMGVPAGGGLNFQVLERSLQENATVTQADLKDGRVPDAADVLVVAAPDKLEPPQLFAVDQFLMKGGTVVVATSPFAPSLRGNVSVAPQPSGMKDWLASYGLGQDDAMVLDPQNSPFPVPVERDIAGVPIRQMHLLDYPYFVDIRPDGMAKGEAPTSGLNQLTLSWASPIQVDEAKAKGRKLTKLIESSRGSWVSPSVDVLPDFKAHPQLGFAPGKDAKRQLLAVAMEGQFTSFFAGKPSPLAKDAAPEQAPGKPADPAQPQADPNDPSKKAEAKPSITGVIERSPESARIILVGSSSFLSDELLEVISAVDRTQYATPMRFVENLIDWSLEDRSLLELRSRGGQFSRTLPPMSEASQMAWEYANYGFALLGLLAIYLFRRFARKSAQRRYLDILKPQGA